MRRTKPSIVVVEAYSAMGLLIDELLTSEGYLVRVWPEAAGAAAFIQQEQPDLVILDLWLRQRGDGLPILDQLWAKSTTRQIPLIVLTDDACAVPWERVLPAAQRLALLAKPFALEDLLAKVAQVLEPGNAPSPAAYREGGMGRGGVTTRLM